MATIASLSRFRALASPQALTRPHHLRVSVGRRTPTRSFSQQFNGKGKENASGRDARSNEGKNSNGGRMKEKARSPHAQWYSDFLPGMIPIALLGSAVYIGLQLVQTKLATEKYLDEANARIAQLEEEIKRLQSEQEQEASRQAKAQAQSQSRGSADSGSLPRGRRESSSSSRWWWPWS